MSLGNKEVMAKNIKRLMAQKQVDAVDVCNALGFKTSTFSYWVNAKTYPRIDKIELMSNYFGVPKSALIEEQIPSNAIPYEATGMVPVLGCIPAGNPLLAEECIEGYEPVDVADPQNYYFLRVQGDSMINAGIQSGDLVLIRLQNYAENGQIVACRVNGDEATLKRFREQDDSVILLPENPAYEPRIINKKDFADGDASIMGVAVEVKRKLL